MVAVTNKRLVFKQVPTQGWPVPGETTVYDPSQTIDLDTIPLNGGFLVKTLYVSLDYWIYSRMVVSGGPFTGIPHIPLDGPVQNYGVGVILRSENPNYKPGQHVYHLHAFFPFEEYFVVSNDEHWMAINNSENIPWSNYLSVLGMAGQTAYLGWKAFAKPKKGEVVFISSAAGLFPLRSLWVVLTAQPFFLPGTVGSVVAQLAKLDGLKVIGSAGSDDKVKLLQGLGVDVAFNYKTSTINKVLAQHGPIDIFWDNVGGEALEAALNAANRHARFVECGMIGDTPNPYFVKNLRFIVHKSISLNGFVVPELMHPDAMAEFYENVPKLVASGSITALEDIRDGFEKGGETFVEAMVGHNGGKVILKIAD
ncbi:hypothetical protein ONZ45_g13428 [Pleurotus djamor]|nr:hypothetical protein ONZ45_g13428 [Pleurotus djamor]